MKCVSGRGVSVYEYIRFGLCCVLSHHTFTLTENTLSVTKVQIIAMAALLKKRALAEYSLSRVVTEPADVARPKKLRLTKKSSEYSERDTGASVSTSIASLSDEKPPEQIFCTLSSIAACMPVNVSYGRSRV